MQPHIDLNSTYNGLAPLWMLVMPVLLAGSVIVLVMNLYRSQVGVSRARSALLTLVSFVAGGAAVFYRGALYNRFGGPSQPVPVILLLAFAGLLPLVAIPFLTRLYLKWIGGELTEAEKAPGLEGVRAWLRGGNVICVLLISLCAWQGFDCSFLGVLALLVMALLAYPVLNMASASFQPVAAQVEDLSPERERVLKMLDDGKITAEESAELLNALGHTVRPVSRPPVSSASPQRKLVLIGLALLLIGFFLPWFSFNPGREMSRLAEAMQQNSGMQFNQPGISNAVSITVKIAGGEIRYGLGWWVLLLGIAAAALPYVMDHLDARTQQKAALVGLSLGGIILIYLLTQNLRFVGIGLILGLAGYALEFMGTLGDRRASVG